MNLPSTCTPSAAEDVTGRKMADDEHRRSGDFPGQIHWADIPAECDYFTEGWPAFPGCIPVKEMVRDEGSVHTIPVKPGNRIEGEQTKENHG